MRRSRDRIALAAALLALASAARAITQPRSAIQTWGYFGVYDSNGQTTIDWPTKLNMPLVIGGVDVQGPIVGTMHSRAATAGNTDQAVVFYLGFAGNDNACSCYEETVGDAWMAAHPTWQLKNSSAQYVFTSDNNCGGSCPRVRAMDIGDTGYVNAWADEIIAEAARHGWDGVLADYVFRCNSAFPFFGWTNASGTTTTPRRTATGINYTCTTYRDDMLAAMKILKTRLHAAGLILVANHGGAYNDNCDGSHDFQDTRLQDQLAQFDFTQLEMCIYDGGNVAYNETCWIDQLKYGKAAVDRGVAYLCQGYNGQINNTAKRPYILASTLLVSDGKSGVGQLNGTSNWDAATYEMKIGEPLPCTWPGFQVRQRQDNGDECIDGAGAVVPCPGVQYRRRRDRTEECVGANGTAITRGCDGSNLPRRRHMDREPECVNSAGVVQVAPIPYECLDANSNPTTTGCPGTLGYTYRRRFSRGAVIVNPQPAANGAKTIYFSEPHGSGTFMEGCIQAGGGYADTLTGPTGEVCWYTNVAVTTTTAPVTTTTTLPGLGGTGGTINFVPVMDSSFDPYTGNPSAAQKTFMQTHYARALTYPPYFDTRLSWFPNAWAYLDSYAIYVGQGVDTAHPEWILRDGANNKLYIPFNCSGGTCPQYAGDIGNSAFRASIIAKAQAMATTGYKGIFFDDVNMRMQVGDGSGALVAPIDPRTGIAMTTTAWRDYMATLCEELRAALPTKEIVHNQVYYFAPSNDPSVIRSVIAATVIWMERGFDDSGIVGGTGQFGFETALGWLGAVKSAGRGVAFEPSNLTFGQEYAMAMYYLLANGQDGLSSTVTANPDTWSTNWEVNLGTPSGAWYRWNTLFRRDFSAGMVLVNQPDAATVNASLGGTWRKLDNSTITSVSMAARTGLVLRP